MSIVYYFLQNQQASRCAPMKCTVLIAQKTAVGAFHPIMG